jgi:uncharacterized membrane protein
MSSGTDVPRAGLLSKHRLEGLTDAVYAVALTILVLELRPPSGESRELAELYGGLAHLLPKGVAWLVSFAVLAAFWVAHHRVFHWVRHVDGKLLQINLVSLLFASFLPFCSSLVGEWARAFVSEALYAAVLAALGLVALWQLRHLQSHPQLLAAPIPGPILRGARLRSRGLVATALLAVAIAAWRPPFATMAFALMAVVNPLARRVERGAVVKTAA